MTSTDYFYGTYVPVVPNQPDHYYAYLPLAGSIRGALLPQQKRGELLPGEREGGQGRQAEPLRGILPPVGRV